jgi:hypothetical protein
LRNELFSDCFEHRLLHTVDDWRFVFFFRLLLFNPAGRKIAIGLVCSLSVTRFRKLTNPSLELSFHHRDILRRLLH